MKGSWKKKYLKFCGLKKVPKGMTLVEMLVSVFILAIGCLAAMGIQSKALISGSYSNNLTIASFLAESQAEWLRSLDFNRVQFVSSQPEFLGRDGEICAEEDNCPYTRTTTVIPSFPTSRSCHVAIKVEWVSVYKKHELVYETVLSARGF